jgi:hypothetical protein
MKLKLDSERLMAGTVVARPPGNGQGFWIGAPSVYRDPASGNFYLTYRIRRPRGGDPATERGGESRIAVSRNGFEFEDIWSVKKAAYETTSIEKSVLWRDDAGLRYFTSFVKPSDGRWCVARMSASSVEELDPAEAEILFDPVELGLEGVKDPWIHFENGVFTMFLSVAKATAETSESSHATHDIYNTGECKSATAMATSTDLANWSWQGVILEPDQGWDGYCRRLNTAIKVNGRYLGFYDGIASHRENYEEKTGLAVSDDLRNWEIVSESGPVLESPHGMNALRYVSACEVDDSLLLFYEVATEDGSHDLRALSIDKRDLVG